MQARQVDEDAEEVMRDPMAVLALLRADDTVVHCQGTGWRLSRGDVRVSAEAVEALRLASGLPDPATGRPLDLGGGRLRPVGDGLPGLGVSQTWEWEPAGPRSGRRAARAQPGLFALQDDAKARAPA